MAFDASKLTLSTMRLTLAFVVCWTVLMMTAVSSSSNASPTLRVIPRSYAAQTPVADTFYRNLIKSVASTSGFLRVEFRSGEGRTRVSGVPDISWSIPAGTAARARFTYSNEAWRRFRIDFEGDPVGVLLREGTANEKRVEFSAITFRENGEPLDYFDRGGSPYGTALSGYPELRAHLKVEGLSALFVGPLFAGTPDSQEGVGFSVQQVSLVLGPERDRPVRATLRRDSTLSFQPSGPDTTTCAETWVSLREQADVVFNSLTYRAGGIIDSIITPQAFPLRGACVDSGDTKLKVGAGGRLTWDSLRLLSTTDAPVGGSVTGYDGLLRGSLEQPTILTLTKGADERMWLRPGAGSSVDLRSVELEVTSGSTMLHAGETSVFTIRDATGQMPLGADSNFQARRLEMSASISGVWKTGAVPALNGTLRNLKGEIEAGRLTLDEDVILSAGGGTINAEGRNLLLRSTESPFVTGIFSSVAFQLREDTTLKLPYKKTVTAAPGGSFRANDRLAPFTILPVLAHAIGRFSLGIPFSKLTYADTPEVYLIDGRLTTELLVAQDSTLVWSPSPAVSGTQVGSYEAVEGIAQDEYKVLARYPSGKVRTMQADHRVMIINSIPAKTATVITLHDTGKVSNARLDRDVVIDGVPLRSGTDVSIYRTAVRVKSGTLANEFTLDGKVYPAGTTITIPWIKTVENVKLFTSGELDPILRRIQSLIADRLVDALYRRSSPDPACLWGNPSQANRDIKPTLNPIRADGRTITYPYEWDIAGMLKNTSPMPACDCRGTLEVTVELKLVNKALRVLPAPLTGKAITYACQSCPWYSYGSYHDYGLEVWRSVLINDLGRQEDKPLVGSLDVEVKRRAETWVADNGSQYVDAEPGSFFMKDLSIDCGVLFMNFGYQVQ